MLPGLFNSSPFTEGEFGLLDSRNDILNHSPFEQNGIGHENMVILVCWIVSATNMKHFMEA